MKLLVIDGNSIVNRAFFGIKLLTTKDGRFTNAIYGFLNILLKLKETADPDAVAFAFDLKAPTFRHEMYKEYKYGVAIFRLPNDCKPSTPIQSFAYRGGTGECFTYYIDSNGDVKFGTTIPVNTRVRIYECFFTS